MRFDELMEYAREKGMEIGLEEGRKEGRQQGRQQTLLELLEMHGTVPEELRVILESESDENQLSIWCRLAAKVQSVSEFTDKM